MSIRGVDKITWSYLLKEEQRAIALLLPDRDLECDVSIGLQDVANFAARTGWLSVLKLFDAKKLCPNQLLYSAYHEHNEVVKYAISIGGNERDAFVLALEKYGYKHASSSVYRRAEAKETPDAVFSGIPYVTCAIDHYLSCVASRGDISALALVRNVAPALGIETEEDMLHCSIKRAATAGCFLFLYDWCRLPSFAVQRSCITNLAHLFNLVAKRPQSAQNVAIAAAAAGARDLLEKAAAVAEENKIELDFELLLRAAAANGRTDCIEFLRSKGAKNVCWAIILAKERAETLAYLARWRDELRAQQRRR